MNLNQKAPSLAVHRLQPSHQKQWDLLTSYSFMQSWTWGEFKRLEGFNVSRVGIFEHDRMVGGAAFYHYPRSHCANLLLATGGPCFLPGYAEKGLPLLLEFAQGLAIEWGAIALRMQPLVPLLSNEFTRAPADVLPIETLVVDLNQSETELLAGMKPKGRYNINVSQRHGVEIRFTNDAQAIPRFYDLFWATAQRQDFFAEPYRYLINLCQTLFAAGMAEIGFATYEEMPLATMLLIHWNGMTTYLYGGRDPVHSEVMANYGLHWAAMQRAKERGNQSYDFYGYSPNPQHPYGQFSRFKQKFGGRVQKRPGAQDYIFYPQLAATLIDLFDSGAGYN